MPKILKANGVKEDFNPTKLQESLERSKVKPEIISDIIEHVKNEITDGTTTAQIYKHAFFLLHNSQKSAAKRYALRRAVQNLGPSGFPFEKYVAEILKSQGYTTETDQLVQGGCVTHEVDVVAWNDAKLLMAEAKFHNDQSMKTDLKVALYIKARFDDLRDATHFYGGKRRKVDEAWLITNTKFTTTAIEYAMCKGLTLIGWNFPGKMNLQSMIEDGDLMPLTSLTDIDQAELKLLFDAGIVLCKQVRGNKTLLVDAGIHPDRAQMIVDDASSMQN
jgi:hypothetical protein